MVSFGFYFFFIFFNFFFSFLLSLINPNPYIIASFILSVNTFSPTSIYKTHTYSYEEALKTNPVLAKMVISEVVYSGGDWIGHCFDGKPLFENFFPFQDWWVVPAKVICDQTVVTAVWNGIYYILWPFTHRITYGVVPVEQRLLWVNCVELIWATILSTWTCLGEKASVRLEKSQQGWHL
ncbi:hypothetical protein UlMin_012616 [Ulmus minor]